MSLTVEFFGIPRARAGVASLELRDEERPRTLGELWPALAARLPEFAYCLAAGGLEPHYRVNFEGQRFVDSPATSLAGVTHVLVMSADAGG